MALTDDDSALGLALAHPNYLWKDLTRSAGAPLSDGAPMGYVVEGDKGKAAEHVVYRGKSGKIYRLSRTQDDDWRWECLHDEVNLRVNATTDPVAYYFGDEKSDHVIFVAADGAVHEFHRQEDPGRWGHTNLTDKSDCRLSSRPAAFALEQRQDQHVVGAGRDGKIYELHWGGPPRPPNYRDPVEAAMSMAADMASGQAPGAPRRPFQPRLGDFHHPDRPPIQGRPAVLVGIEPVRQHIFYRSPKGRLHELRWTVSERDEGVWTLLPVEGAGLAPALGNPSATARGTEHLLAYLGPDGRLHRLRRKALHDPVWEHLEVDARADGSHELAAYVWPRNGAHHVIYVDRDGALHECVFGSGSPVTQRLAAGRVSHAPSAYTLSAPPEANVVFRDDRGHVCALRRRSRQVFISHATADKEKYAEPLANELRRLGLRVWMDKDELNLGDAFGPRIRNAVVDTPFRIVLLSRQSMTRDWPSRERQWMLELERQGQGQVFLILIDLSVEEVPVEVKHLLSARWERGCETLAHDISERINGS